MAKKPIHYLLVGYPFAGKTTLAKELEKRFGFVRLSVDDVKFELGFECVSEDDISDEDWKKIFKELDRRIAKALKENKTVLNEYAWVTKEWRNRARKLADDLGIETKVIIVDVDEDVVRDRWKKNRGTNGRFDLTENVFEEAIKTFEKPSDDENIVVYDGKPSIDDWIKKNF